MRGTSSAISVISLLSLMLAACSRLPASAGSTMVPVEPVASESPAVLRNGAVIDGHQVGPLMDCSSGCEGALAFAQQSAIETRGLDPNEVRDVTVYVPYTPPGETSTGGGYVVVYGLDDGSRIGIRVHCGVGPCQLIEPQPIDQPAPIDYSCNDSGCVKCQAGVCEPWVPPSEEARPTTEGVPETSPTAGYRSTSRSFPSGRNTRSTV